MMKLVSSWKNASLRTKILIPFVSIFVVSVLLGAYYFIHVLSGMLESNMEKRLGNLSLAVSEGLSHQEERILFHAQNMAETKRLADEILNTNQVRLLQIHELQALRSEHIRFLGVYGADLPAEDPLYPLVQKGLRGLRVTALAKLKGPDGDAWHLVGVAPVSPAADTIREVVLLGTPLRSTFLQDLAKRLGVEIVLFDREGHPFAGTFRDLRAVQEAFSGAPLLVPQSGAADTRRGLESLEIKGTPYRVMGNPFSVNYQETGAFLLMAPVREIVQTRMFLVVQVLIYALCVLVGMSLLYLFIIRGITTPLKVLEGASKKMMEGGPVEGVPNSSMDEVGTLSRSFNRMIDSLQQRERELRLKMEESRRQTEELNAILGHMGEGVAVQNAEYEIEYMNEAAVRSFGNHLGEKCYHVFYDRDTPCDPCSVEEIIRKKRPVFQYSTQDHEGRYFEVIAQPLHDLDGNTKVITLRRDVTERMLRFEEEKRMQEKIQQERIEAIRQVGVSVKHGINNSLAAIFGGLEFFKGEDLSLSEDEREMVGLLETEAHKIRDIISKLSRITDVVVTEYMDDIRMIDLENSGKGEGGD